MPSCPLPPSTRSCARSFFGCAVASKLQGRAQRLFRNGLGNAVGDYVDESARSTVPVQQCRGTAHHLDALSEQRIDGDRVIVRQRRRVERGTAVLVHLHALAADTANDGPARLRPEIRRRHSGLRRQCFAEREGAGANELIATQQGGGLCGFECGLAQGRRGDDDLLEIFVFRRRGVSRPRGGADER